MLYPVLSGWFDNDFDDLLNYNYVPATVQTTAPAINVKENGEQYTIEVAAPGSTKDNFSLSLDKDGNLHIKLEQKNEKKEGNKKEHYLRREFSYADYEQALSLPEDVDAEKISAKVEDGVLRIALPKKSHEQVNVKKSIEVA